MLDADGCAPAGGFDFTGAAPMFSGAELSCPQPTPGDDDPPAPSLPLRPHVLAAIAGATDSELGAGFRLRRERAECPKE